MTDKDEIYAVTAQLNKATGERNRLVDIRETVGELAVQIAALIADCPANHEEHRQTLTQALSTLNGWASQSQTAAEQRMSTLSLRIHNAGVAKANALATKK